MRISLICAAEVPPTGYGGTERVVFWLACGLIERGHDVSIIAPKGSEVPGARMIPANSRDQAIARIPADTHVSHFHGWLPDQDMRVGRPAIATMHGNTDSTLHPEIPFAFVSRDHAQRHGSNLFVHNGVPASQMRFNARKSGRYLFFSRINRAGKNISKAISLTRKFNLALDIAGGRRFDLLARSAVRREGAFFRSLGPRFRFHGMADGEIKQTLFADARALLFPIRWPEPFGLVVIESLLSGTPVITTRFGAMPELVSPEVGYICESDEDYAAALEGCGDISPQLCRDYAIEHFSMDRCVEGYLGLYRRIADGERLTRECTAA